MNAQPQEILKKNKVLETLQIEYVKASSIRPNSYNPNRQSSHDFYLLVMSMTEDGFTQPIIAQGDSREIVDGEHRWTCAIVTRFIKNWGIKANVKNKAIGEELAKLRATNLFLELPVTVKDGKELVGLIRHNRANIIDPELTIPVVFVSMTAEQMRIATLRHNRARGSEDIDLSAALLRDLRELGALDWAQDSLMLDEVEMNRLLEDMSAPQALANAEYGEAWQPSNAGTKQGDSTDGASTVSMTPEAVEQVRAQEIKIAAAKTEEERISAVKDTDIYRLSLIFSGDEAVAVKAALGATPAAMILSMCKAHLATSGE